MKKPHQNKARTTQPGSKKEPCPICRVPFTPGVGLAAHIRFKHGNAPQAVPVASNQAPGECPQCGRTFKSKAGLLSHIWSMHPDMVRGAPVAGNKAPEPAITVVPILDAQTHLRTAIDQLATRKKQIDQELGRMDALRDEGAQIGKRIEALDTAMRAFGQESMAASG